MEKMCNIQYRPVELPDAVNRSHQLAPSDTGLAQIYR